MNICEAIEIARVEDKAIRRKDWTLNLAWYHGMDNQIRWWNDDPASPCVYKTGDEVRFAVADFWHDNYEIHPTVPYHGDLIIDKPTEEVTK